MPELPELEVYKEILSRELAGKTIGVPRFLKPYILKSFPPDYESRFPSKVNAIKRRGKRLLLLLDNGLILCIHLMRSGKLRIQKDTAKPTKFTACILPLDDRRILTISEYGKEKIARFHITDDTNQIPGFASLGIEPLDEALSPSQFHSLLHQEKKKLKQFLTDQRVLAGIGNAYANEILWDAGLSPFSSTTSLSESVAKRLLDSIRKTLQHAIVEIRAQLRVSDLPKDHRHFMSVHGKKDESCPRCGDTIRWVYSTKSTTYYCPTCQTKGKILKDRRTSKFLK